MSDNAFLAIEVMIESPGWTEDDAAIVERAMRAAASHVHPHWKWPAELSVLLTNDAEQRDLNHQWRQKDSSTNVLSFPQIAPFAVPLGLLGDVSFARETLMREAEEQQKAVHDHLSHLSVHAFLHILGYDHIEEDEAERMEALEIDILKGLDIDNPYVEI